jgi:5,10-methylenetetrahydromethanopterin reductase
VHTWPRHPLVLARQAVTVQAAAEGRFSLGLGVGHRPLVEGPLGLRWREPTRHMADYAATVADLVRDRRVERAGDPGGFDAALDMAPGAPVDLVVAALGERMCRTAGSVADAVMTWLAPPAHLAGTTLPTVTAAACEAGREPPRVIAAAPVALEADFGAVRAGLSAAFGFMARAPAYASTIEAAGVSPVATDEGGWTDEAADAVAVWGDERSLGTRVEAMRAAGADEVVLWPFPTAKPAAESLRATLEALGRLARGARWPPDERRGGRRG